MYNTNYQKPKYQSSWLNLPHLQYVYNALNLNSSMYNLQFSFHLIEPLDLVFWIFNMNALLFPRVLFKISFQNVMKYTEHPRHSWVEIVCWGHSRHQTNSDQNFFTLQNCVHQAEPLPAQHLEAIVLSYTLDYSWSSSSFSPSSFFSTSSLFFFSVFLVSRSTD